MSNVHFLEHTGDIGFEVSATSLEALFDAARQGLLQTMFTQPPQEGSGRLTLELNSETREGLLVAWLNELIFLVQTKLVIPVQSYVEIKPIKGWQLKATLTTTPFSESYGWQGEIKSTTYHGLAIKHHDSLWKAQVLLDV